MKKFYLTSFLFLGVISIAISQTKLLNEKHAFQAGDEHYFIIAENTDPMEPGGNNKIWDFSSLEEKGELRSHMLISTEVDKSFNIPEANTVLEEYGNHFYFKVQDNMMKLFGTITKNNTITRYDKPFVKMVYPFEYGDSYSGDISGEIITKNNKRRFSGQYTIAVDGHGKLILPGNIVINNVLRLKAIKEKQYENSDHVSKIVSYKFYCQEIRYPILTIIQSITNNTPKTIKTAYYGDARSIEQEQNTDENKFANQVRIYPNPFKKKINVEYQIKEPSDVQIALYNNAGQKIKDYLYTNQPEGCYTKSITTTGQGFSDGVYFVKVKAGSQLIKNKMIKLD